MFLCQMRLTGKILLLFLIQGFLAFGREAPYVRNFTPADYNAQNQNWSLAQSPKGWIYTGNNGTLLEFDGARWQSFLLPEKQTVRAVATGRAGSGRNGWLGVVGVEAGSSRGGRTRDTRM